MQNILFMFAYIVAQVVVPALRGLADAALLRHLATEMAGLGRFKLGGRLAAQARVRRRARYSVGGGVAWLGPRGGEHADRRSALPAGGARHVAVLRQILSINKMGAPKSLYLSLPATLCGQAG